MIVHQFDTRFTFTHCNKFSMHAKKNLTEHRLTRSCSTGGAELEIAEVGQNFAYNNSSSIKRRINHLQNKNGNLLMPIYILRKARIVPVIWRMVHFLTRLSTRI